jgi:hypothetical protein
MPVSKRCERPIGRVLPQQLPEFVDVFFEGFPLPVSGHTSTLRHVHHSNQVVSQGSGG